MDSNNWRPTQGASGDWRAQLGADSRQRMMNKIMDTLKRRISFSGNERLQELKEIAVRFEEKIYTAATSQSDYVDRITLKLLSMENRSLKPMPDAMQSSSVANSIDPSDPGSQVMQQGFQLSISAPNNIQSGHHMMSHSMQRNIGTVGMQGSSNLSSALPPGSGLQQSTMANVAGQKSNIQNVSGVQQNTIGMGPSIANQRKQMQHYLYQQKLHRMAKQTLQQPSMQSHIQQSNMLQPSHLQPSQQSAMQPAMLPTSFLSSVVQPVLPQSSQPLMNHQQSVLRQQSQQVMPHMQSQSGQLQQQPNLLRRDMQQRLPTSGVSQQQNVIDQQNQQFQQHRAMPEASSNLTAQTGNSNGGDWQEDVYQKIKAMKDLYLLDLSDMHKKLLGKLQQNDSLPQQPKNKQLEKLKIMKRVLERYMQLLQIPKHNILPTYKDKLGYYEKQIIHVINSDRRNPTGPQLQAQALPLPHNMGNLQQRGSNVQQNMMNSIQPSSNLDPGQNSSVNSLQQVSNGSLQQNTVSGPQQVNIKPMTPQANTNMLQHQHFQRRRMQQQFFHKQQLMQQQQLSSVGNIGHQQPSSAVLPTQSVAIGTPGISASPLLAEFTSPDGNHGAVASIGSGKSNIEQPLERLLKVVKSMSPKALSASVGDIGSIVSMIDRIAESAPGNGSRAAVGEDLVAMTKCLLQARNFITQDGPNGMRKMKRLASAMVSTADSVNDETSELDSTAFSSNKRPRIEYYSNRALLEEIKGINQGLIDNVVSFGEEDVDPAAVSESGDGTVITCSFSGVALGPNLKSQYASAQMSPIQPLRLLVPANYPNCSPILLDKFPAEVSKEFEDISTKTKSRFSISLRSLSQPMSLKDIARTWDACAAAVMSEYAQQRGGGTFSSKYGTWENCKSRNLQCFPEL